MKSEVKYPLIDEEVKMPTRSSNKILYLGMATALPLLICSVPRSRSIHEWQPQLNSFDPAVRPLTNKYHFQQICKS